MMMVMMVMFSGARENSFRTETFPVLALRQAIYTLGLVQQSRDLAHLSKTSPAADRNRKHVRHDDGDRKRR